MISGGSFDPDKLSNNLLAIENKLQDPEVWKDHKKLNEFNKQKTVLETKVNEFNDIATKIADIDDLVSISIELNDSDELKNQGTALTELNSEIDSLETKNIFQKRMIQTMPFWIFSLVQVVQKHKIGQKCCIGCICDGQKIWALRLR